MDAVLTVIGCGQEWELFGDAIVRYVVADFSWRAGEEIDPIADTSGDIVVPADHTDRDIRDIVIGALAVWPARLVRA